MRRSLCSLALLTIASLPTSLAAQAPAPGVVSIGRVDSLWSPTLKEWRGYSVYTPPGYLQSIYLKRAYPVLYVLDGPVHFHSLSGLVQILATGVNGTYVIPEMIVVSINNTNRTRDLTPTHSTIGYDGKAAPGLAASGGGENFLTFMRTELVPHIDTMYRTEPYRVFVGHSFGGITVINALYTTPNFFNAYVAIDPSFWWDNWLQVRKAADYLRSAKLSGRTLVVAHANTVDLGSGDPQAPCIARARPVACSDTAMTAHTRAISEFDRMVRASNASGLRYAYKYYPADDHGSVPLIAGYDALRFIFDSYKIDLAKKPSVEAVKAHFAALSKQMGYAVTPPEKLLEVIGQVAMNPDTVRAVAILRFKTELYPRSPHAFKSLGAALLVTRDTTGARAAYQQSLSLNPDDQAVKDVLAKLGR